MAKDPGSERRSDERTSMVLKVEYSDPEDLLADYLTDVGEGGLFVCTQAPFEIGDRIAFSISFPKLLEPVALQGIVRWHRSAEEAPQESPGVGVELVYDNDAHRQQIRSLLEKLREQASRRPPARPTPFRVLLVEDNHFAHDLFRHAVKRFHRELDGTGELQVLSAHNGQEALEIASQNEVDLAIVDYFLPVMTGDELIRRIREDERNAHTPILVISVGGEGVREESLGAGADLYLDKPVMLKQLLTTLHLLLHQHAGDETTVP